MSMFFAPGRSKRAAVTGRKSLLPGLALCLSLSYPSFAAAPKRAAAPKPAAAPKARKTTAPRLSVAEIVKRHVSARGGLEAWQAVQTLSLSGKMDAGSGDSVARSMRIGRGPGTATQKTRREIVASPPKVEPEKQVQLPFTLARERPNKSRLEIEFGGKTAVQVYDGKKGWKLRPYLNRTDVEPFTAQEAKAEAQNADMDAPLIDYKAKGMKVHLDGVETVEGRDAYKLKVTTKSGVVKHVFVDAHSFLDVKVEGVPRRLDGKMHDVWVYQRDFRPVNGVMIPFVLETVVDGYPQSHKIVVDKVAVNPKLDAATFGKPKA